MPPSAPFSVGSAQPLPYPALYLYPLNDSFVPKHIALSHGQHVKIGRQTNAKTAPGERNGYFDSKVLSRQHAEVWEDAGKIFIKDVKSSNGTFINGERLSSEAVESDPYELKSDDIVEFGIDIVGEDNKTIIHHKVAARVICVFTEQDAQVAARAEQHQHQQQLQYQHQQQAAQQSQQQHGGHGHPNGVMGGAAGMMPPGPSAAQSGFNFSGGLGVGGGSAGLGVGAGQRRQMAQQPSLGGMGGMGGGMRPPGKSGLTFDVILSRLQGELQKSRETGAELNTLTGALGEVHESLSGGLPPNLPAFPSTLPPVRPAAQEPPGPAGSPHQTSPPTSSSPPPATSVPPTVIAELQLQLRDTQSTLATQLEKIRALEAVLSEQEVVKSEVRTLREIVEERTREIEGGASRRRRAEGAGHPSLGGRGGFDLEEDEDRGREEEGDDDDDARSVMTVMPHELESVEEEDEEGAADQDERDARDDDNDQTEDLSERDEEGKQQLEDGRSEERGRKSLSLCVEDAGAEFERPRTPEPFATSTFSEVKSKAAPHSPSAIPSTTTTTAASGSSTHDEIQAQIAQLTAQVTSVMQLTGTLEAQHSAAQSTIRALETKVGVLEGLLKASVASPAITSTPPPASDAPDKSLETGVAKVEPKAVEGDEEATTLTSRIAEWMKSVDGQWASVQDEWGLERERLNRAREEWEAKVKLVEGGLERVERVANAAAASATAASASASAAAAASNHANGHSISSRRMNGDAVKHRGGLVTPPSPRSQSSGSESGRYQGRRRRGGHGRRHSSSASESLSESDEDGSGSRSASPSRRDARRGGAVDDADLEFDHSEASAGGESKEGSLAGSVLESARARARALATPEPSVYKASSPASEVALAILEHEKEEAGVGKVHARDMGRGKEGLNGNNINVQTAVGVLLLSFAAAAVIWKVKPE